MKQCKAARGQRGVRGASGIQPPQSPHRSETLWLSLRTGFTPSRVTNHKSLPSVRCSRLKELVEVFVNFKATKSEAKVIWTFGDVRLCKIHGANSFGQQINSADNIAVCRNALPT